MLHNCYGSNGNPMATATLEAEDEIEKRKSAAISVLRWIDEELRLAPEVYVRDLYNNIAIAVCKSTLEATVTSGQKITASVLASLDSQRLDNLHIAALQDPLNPDGRKVASEHTVKAAKFLALEHKLIDHALLQYCVPSLPNKLAVKNDKKAAARFVIELIHEMAND